MEPSTSIICSSLPVRLTLAWPLTPFPNPPSWLPFISVQVCHRPKCLLHKNCIVFFMVTNGFPFPRHSWKASLMDYRQSQLSSLANTVEFSFLLHLSCLGGAGGGGRGGRDKEAEFSLMIKTSSIKTEKQKKAVKCLRIFSFFRAKSFSGKTT